MSFRILRNPISALILMFFSCILISGCAHNPNPSLGSLEFQPETTDNGSFNRKGQDKGQILSLYDVISGAVNNVGGRLEKRAAIKAYENCRTSSVFINYHVKQIYRALFDGISRDNVGLDQQQGFVYVSLPKIGHLPDAYALAQLASVVAKNEHVYVFIPNSSPFRDDQHVAYLLGLKDAFAENGVDKDHVRILPMTLFEEAPSPIFAENNGLPLKLCYG